MTTHIGYPSIGMAFETAARGLDMMDVDGTSLQVIISTYLAKTYYH
jgi:hypothetical protein